MLENEAFHTRFVASKLTPIENLTPDAIMNRFKNMSHSEDTIRAENTTVVVTVIHPLPP